MSAPRRIDSDGSCLCGAVRFVAAGELRFVANCHCENCRRAHGAGVVTWAGLDLSSVSVSDEGACSRYVSDTGATWSFCSTCGSRLFYVPRDRPDEIHVPAAAFDDGIELEVSRHVYADRAPSWCPIEDELPRFGGPSGRERLG